MKRCVETARKGLLEATGRGVRIQIMPTLAGRNGGIPWTLREENQEQDISGPWVGEVADPRSKTKDADFVIGWLNGKDLSLQEAQKVLEVVVVSQMQLLQELLWRIKGGKSLTSGFELVDPRTRNLQGGMAGLMQLFSPIRWMTRGNGLIVSTRKILIV